MNLAQVIKGLRAERGRARKEVARLERAISALVKLDGRPGRQAQAGKKRNCAQEDIASSEGALGKTAPAGDS